MLESLSKLKIRSKVYRELPETPGIYIFFKKRTPIYIGKAVNLKRRVSSYFDLELGSKTSRMVNEANFLSYIRVDSELEALLLEAKLIRTYMPRYNSATKDDKHPLYIAITSEEFPRVQTVRKLIANRYPLNATYGPFPSSTNVRSVLRMLRRIFPYSDHKLGKRPCLYSHLGLCNPCPNGITTSEERKIYLKNIRRINAVLSGKFDGVKKELIKEMQTSSKLTRFEEASLIRNQVKRLEYITQPQIPAEFYMQNPNLVEDLRSKELKDLMKILKSKSLHRIECFDIAHFAGVNPTASMVTFVDGEADKNYYRHFRIRQKKGNSDIDSLKEVVKRRLNHIKDWGKPDLVIVDGGVAQVNAFDIGVPVVGIAKNPDRLIIGHAKIRLSSPALNLVQRLRDEAHRFARRYHHHLISKVYENSS